MTGERKIIGEGAFGPEPQHDEALGALLAEATGRVPMDAVNWSALAERISTGVAIQSSPWWSFASRYERRMIPIALAAGVAAVLALYNFEVTAANSGFVSAASVSTAIVSGVPYEDAAQQFARSVTSVADITAGTPE
jgi:hypothetical protein